MCSKDDRIKELELELKQAKEDHFEREARLFETLASGRNHESQEYWRPWQVVMIPVAITLVSGLITVAIALFK
ncbi:hypothetical protein AAFX24_07930 [Vibrio mediterranei]|uniref:hypothetical protein n=1 Tax=Vibrio mediterranei TaxID=689 RepID=UPI0038CE7530